MYATQITLVIFVQCNFVKYPNMFISSQLEVGFSALTYLDSSGLYAL